MQIDGRMLIDCDDNDFHTSDFPKARSMHWKKFWSVGKITMQSSNILTSSSYRCRNK